MPDPVVILGAGLTGLSAAYCARKRRIPTLLFEKETREGGLVRSQRVGAFTFDHTGHLLHTRQERTKRLVLRELGLGRVFAPVARNAWVYSQGIYTPAPFQANLFGFPPAMVKECLRGALEAHLQPQQPTTNPESFEDWNLRTLGLGIYRHFMQPYNTKLWGVPPARMTTEFMGRFVPKPSLEEIFRGALIGEPQPLGYNANFLYPRRGGIEVLSRAFARHVATHCSHQAVEIDPRRRELRFHNGLRQHYSRLISTISLPRLVEILKGAPRQVRQAARRLRASSVLNVNLGIRNRNVSDKQWIYVPEKDLPFYRVGFYHNFSPHLAPQGGSSIYAETSYDSKHSINKEEAIRKVRQGLLKMGILRKSDAIAAQWITDIPDAYVIYDQARTQSVRRIQTYLQEQRIHSTGRWGNWEYASMEDAIWQGVEAMG